MAEPKGPVEDSIQRAKRLSKQIAELKAGRAIHRPDDARSLRERLEARARHGPGKPRRPPA
jgi:hypothetical protein